MEAIYLVQKESDRVSSFANVGLQVPSVLGQREVKLLKAGVCNFV
jgi:hypothetical protein